MQIWLLYRTRIETGQEYPGDWFRGCCSYVVKRV